MLLVAFLGTHVPLVILSFYFAIVSSISLRAKLRTLLVALVATLAGTAATLLGLRALLAPVSSVSEVLRRYLDHGELPELPTGYQDEAGKLMSDVRYVAERLDQSLRSLGEQAATDPLTGVYNRRVAQERLYEDLARVERGRGAFTLALLDLDQFKPVNDRFGHGAGDACIKHVASVLSRNVRGEDWVARWGGDEFLVRVSEAGEASSGDQALERLAEELRKSPARLPNGEEVRLTFSGGLVRCSGQGDDVEGLLERADEALYRAKRDGGDTIVRA
jgi:diguanylate cyclase (GGDEF)-like protein